MNACFKGGKLKWITNSLFVNKSFKIQDYSQVWSMIVATKTRVLHHHLFWNMLYCHKHAKTESL